MMRRRDRLQVGANYTRRSPSKRNETRRDETAGCCVSRLLHNNNNYEGYKSTHTLWCACLYNDTSYSSACENDEKAESSLSQSLQQQVVDR